METSVEEVRQAVETILESFDENDKILALTDIYGGSITRVIKWIYRCTETWCDYRCGIWESTWSDFMKDTMEYDETCQLLIDEW